MLDFSVSPNSETSETDVLNNLRTEKLQILNKTELDEVDLAFDVSALKVLASRYLLRNADGMIVEGPKQMFERIATLVAISDILHDTRVFDISGAQVKDENYLLRLAADISIGKYKLNEYHIDALCRLYCELDLQHKMRLNNADLICMLQDGEFDSYENRIKEYYDLMVSKDFLPNTPTLMNAGAPLGQLSACFVLDIQDDMPQIMDTAKDVAMIFKSGGGVGINYSKLRQEGDMVSSTSGVASGPLSFMNVIDAVTGVVKQGGKRRGANMGILDCSHPDIDKFIRVKTKAGVLENFNISVGVDSKFWEALMEDTVYLLNSPRTGEMTGARYARSLINNIAASAWESAEPGLIFFDNINRHNPLITQKGPLTATNPCFHPDTIVDTVEGRKQIKDITRPIRVYTCGNDGKLTTRMASPSWITKKNARTLKITLSNGKQIVVTPDHKLLTNKYGWIEAVNLRPRTRLVELCRQRRGARYSGIRLSTEDKRAHRMEHRFVYEQTTGVIIPSNMDIHHLDGNTFNNNVLNLDMIPHSQHAQLTACVQPNNHQVRDGLGKFIESGRHGQKIIINLPQELVSKRCSSPTVSKIEEGPITDVYDIIVEETHNVIANGIVAHNCGEQSLYPYESCNLGSINLANFVNPNDGQFDWPRYSDVIKLCTRFLDNVIDMNKYPLPNINTETKKTRRIGLGVMGLADVLFKLNVAYNSAEGYDLMDRFAEWLSFGSMIESCKLAKERGSYPLYDKDEFMTNFPVAGAQDDEYWNYIKHLINEHGIRNAWTTTVAPTGTLSMLANCSSGIEPVFALSFEKHVTVGKFTYTNDVFREQFLDLFGGQAEKAISLLKNIISNYGSCRGIQEIPDNIQKVFVTAMDLHWADHVYAEAVWQKWISNAIAKTINMPGDATISDVRRAYLLAHELGLKGITVYRDGSRATQVLNIASDSKVKKFEVAPSSMVKAAVDNLEDGYVKEEVSKIFAEAEPTVIPAMTIATATAVNMSSMSMAGGHVGVLEQDKCPSCLFGSILRTEGCKKCMTCGWSACSSG
jgi:ribonucleoside-diphosphate reductase alpha chain